jgi:prevent-host-death family protein
MEHEEIGIFEAKTHFSEVVDKVLRNGRPITVTRRGKPAVEISPIRSTSKPRMSRSEAFAELDKLRQEVPRMTHQEIVDLIAEGRPGHE